MKNTHLILSLGIVVSLAVLAPANANASTNFNAVFTPPPWMASMGIFSPALPPGTKQEFEAAKNTGDALPIQGRIERDTTPQAPSKIAADHARAVAARLQAQQREFNQRAAETRGKKPEIRKDRQAGQENNETAPTLRSQRKTDAWSARGGRLLTAAMSQVVRGFNRDPQAGTGNPMLRLKNLHEGPGCKAVDRCGVSSNTPLTPREQFALFLARGCNALGICYLYGGTEKDIAMLRGKMGLPMFAAALPGGKLRAIPIQASSGGGGDDTYEGAALQPDQFKTAKGCKVEAGKCLDAIVTTALIDVNFVAPDMKAELDGPNQFKHADYRVMGDDGEFIKASLYGGGAAKKDKKSYILVEGETQIQMREIDALRIAQAAGQAVSRVACMANGALRASQKGPSDGPMDNLLSDAGTPRDDTSGGFSARDRKELARAQVAKRNAGSDSEAGSPRDRINNSEDSRAKSDESADSQMQSGQNCPQVAAGITGGSNTSASLTGPMILFQNPQVIAWMNERDFPQRVIAWRTVMPEIYAAENEEIDKITTTEMASLFGEKYAQYAFEQKLQNEEYMLSLNNTMKQFGLNPQSNLPFEIAGGARNAFDLAAIQMDGQSRLSTFVASIIPDVIKNDGIAVVDAGDSHIVATPIAIGVPAPIPTNPLDGNLSNAIVSRMMATPIVAVSQQK